MKPANKVVGLGTARTRMLFGKWYIQLLDHSESIEYQDGPMTFREAWAEQKRFVVLGYMKEY